MKAKMMEKWAWLIQGAINPRKYTGRQVVERFRLLDFEIFDLLKKGLQAYTDTGKRVVDSDSLPKGKRWSLEFIEGTERAKQNARVICGPGLSLGRSWSENEIKREAKRIYDRQPLEILNPPKDCFPFSFTLPDYDKSRKEAISTALGFLFKPKDVEEFEQAQGIKPIGPSFSPTPQTERNKSTEITTPEDKQEDYWATQFPELRNNKAVRPEGLSNFADREKGEVALPLDDYVQKRLADKIDYRVIAFELCDENGSFRLSHAACAKILKIGDSSVNISHDAWKKRGRRAVMEGKKLLQKQKKSSR